MEIPICLAIFIDYLSHNYLTKPNYKIKNVSNKLKEVKGFGDWSLGKYNRNMISGAIVSLAYADYLKEKSNIDVISNNIILDIIIAIEIACMIAVISTSSASSTASN